MRGDSLSTKGPALSLEGRARGARSQEATRKTVSLAPTQSPVHPKAHAAFASAEALNPRRVYPGSEAVAEPALWPRLRRGVPGEGPRGDKGDQQNGYDNEERDADRDIDRAGQ